MRFPAARQPRSRFPGALLSVLALAVLAGCAGQGAPSTAPVEVDEAADMDAPGIPTAAVALADPAASSSPVLAIDASGPAGSWIVVHAPFAEPVGEVVFEYRYKATAAQGNGGSLFWPFSLTVDEGGGEWSVRRGGPFNERFAPVGQTVWERHGSLKAMHTPHMEGVLVAFASSADWTLSLRIELADVLFGPAVVQRGTGATFAHGSTMAVPVPGGGPANEASFETPVPGPGWSHLEVLRERLQPAGRSEVSLEVPSHASDAQGTQLGYDTPSSGSANGGHLDYLGSLADTAGAARAKVLYVRGDLGAEVSYVHLPLDASLLAGLVGPTYEGGTWPFADGLPV